MNSSVGKAPNVAIIGGGWAGMSAAVELSTNGVPVTVFEAAKTLGGRARRVEFGNAILDNGLHILIGAYTETLNAIEKVTAADEPGLLRLPLQLRVEPGFELRASRLPAPFHMAAALTMARGLSVSDKIAAARFMLAQRNGGFSCEPGLKVSTLLGNFQQPGGVVEFLWAPLCVSALNTNPDEADAQVFLNVLQDSLGGPREASDLLLPQTDFSSLFPDPAARFVEANGGTVCKGEAVTSVRLADAGIDVTAASTTRYSHAIIAVGPHRLEQVAAHIPELEEQVRMVRGFQYQPIYSVFLQYPEGASIGVPMIGLRNALAQWIFDRGQLCNQPGLFGVVISASGAHQKLPQEALSQRVHQELHSRFGFPEPLWSQVIAEKRATFACSPGLQRPASTTPVHNLFIAGDYTRSRYPATLESAVRSGRDCARQILEGL